MIPVKKRLSTYANIASIAAAAIMTQSDRLGLPDAVASWVWIGCSITVGVCQLIKQGEL